MYQDQDRGNTAAYESYYRGMDKSMRQKIALVSSYFPDRGRIADMGCGSGSGSHDLAGLYPALEVVGVDVNPRSVEYSREKYRRPNLSFAEGDIARPVFPPAALTGILNSSVLHHVTSFNDFSVARVRELLDVQVEQLAPEGILAIRDFVIPEGPERVILEIPAADGSADPAGDVATLSTLALFERFAREFRGSRYPRGGLEYEVLDAPVADRRWVRTGLREATEFILRKDYRADWAVEILEEYTYFTQRQFEDEFHRRGLRVLISREIQNPWIVRNRFQGRLRLLDGPRELDFPPTNYIIVGQKVTRGGVRLAPREIRPQNAGYLRLESFRARGSGRVWELASRPGATLDIIPWYVAGEELLVIGRQAYPRPILQVARPLDGTASSGYINEPIRVIATDPTENAATVTGFLTERAGIPGSACGPETRGLKYYPSPGGINESVRAVFVELKDSGAVARARSEGSGFSTSGEIRAFNAAQFLRACQVGGMFDARLELNIYDLLLKQGRSPGPWIGAEIEQPAPIDRPLPAFDPFAPAGDIDVFEKIDGGGEHLTVTRRRFVEFDAAGNEIAGREFEYVLPRHWSDRTITFLPYARDPDGKFWIGLEARDLPAPALHEGSARLLTCPAWRLPVEIETFTDALRFARGELRKEFDCETHEPTPLGASYCPSPGLTPETVTPFAVALDGPQALTSRLAWAPLDELVNGRDRLRDGHLLIALLRFAHAARAADGD